MPNRTLVNITKPVLQGIPGPCSCTRFEGLGFWAVFTHLPHDFMIQARHDVKTSSPLQKRDLGLAKNLSYPIDR